MEIAIQDGGNPDLDRTCRQELLGKDVRSIEMKYALYLGGSLVDIHRHFLGHTVCFDDSSYEHYNPADPSCWICLDIEPSARGSSEIRRLFWQEAYER